VREFRCLPNCGLCCAVSPVTVLPHEVLLIRDLAQALGRDVRFTPGYVILDIKNEVRIALSYLMQLGPEGRCVFLDRDKTCMIHNQYKPLTCRSFPYLPRVIKYSVNPEDRSINFTVRFVVSSLCPVIKGYSEREVEAIVRSGRVAVRIMENEIRAAMETIRARRIYTDTLTALWRAGLVELRGIDRDDHVDWPLVNGYEFIRRFVPTLTITTLIGTRGVS